MFVSLRSNAPILFLGGALATISAGCSRDNDRARDQNAAAATTSAAATIATDSTPMPADTSVAPAESTPRVVAAGTTKTPRPKPSIDPGRKQARYKRPISSPKPTAASPAVPADTPTTNAPANPAPASGLSEGLKYDAGSNTVTFDLIGGPHGFMFNGYGSGGASLTVPAKANVVLNFINKDGTPHSAEVISGEGPLPNAAVDAAISRAYTNQLSQGLPQEGTDVMRFTVPASGSYRIICGVPGHALSGMWIWMKIDPAAKQPSFGPTKK
jgi:plastocyanin